MSEEFKLIKSSNLEAAKYDAATKEMIVKFKNGTVYKYYDILPELWKEFEATFEGWNGKSAGKFFHAHVRHQTCEKIEG